MMKACTEDVWALQKAAFNSLYLILNEVDKKQFN